MMEEFVTMMLDNSIETHIDQEKKNTIEQST